MTSTYQVTRHYHFYAAHRNEAVNDKCRSLHGHTYDVLVTFLLSQSKETGVTVLFSELDKFVDPVIQRLDHSLLLHDKDPLCLMFAAYFESNPGDQMKLNTFSAHTSAENLAKYIFEQVVDATLAAHGSGAVLQVTVKETKSSEVSYQG